MGTNTICCRNLQSFGVFEQLYWQVYHQILTLEQFVVDHRWVPAGRVLSRILPNVCSNIVAWWRRRSSLSDQRATLQTAMYSSLEVETWNHFSTSHVSSAVSELGPTWVIMVGWNPSLFHFLVLLNYPFNIIRLFTSQMSASVWPRAFCLPVTKEPQTFPQFLLAQQLHWNL